MTKQKSFKRRVRERMEKTGESYTSARAALIGAEPAGALPRHVARCGSRSPRRASRSARRSR